jgi:DNA primase
LSFLPDPEVYEWVLERSPLGPEAIGYFADRAITEATLRAFRAGQVPSPVTLAKEAAGRFGHMRVKAAGLLTRRSTPGRPVCVFPQGSVVFPFLRDGHCEYLQARSISGDKLRWISLSGIRPPPFNAGLLDDLSATEVVLCEGISDTLSAQELDRKAVGLLGAGASLTDSDARLLRGRDVYVVADHDAAGGRMGARLHGQLVRAGAHPIIQRLPEGCGDLNEYLVNLRRC